MTSHSTFLPKNDVTSVGDGQYFDVTSKRRRTMILHQNILKTFLKTYFLTNCTYPNFFCSPLNHHQNIHQTEQV
eukprot:TRINITY_DN3799_c0_g1_i1.p1 TRINITY_DN3799_c0_g1~~TRINITY_DN3799_c0_g1_i1.p1  ORF type:complete len:74 (+),score=5.56 TRINITY_DN3799_c0_g1_i1:65-286(+)